MRQVQHELGLQRPHKRRAKGKHHVAFQVFMLRLRDARAFLRALKAQFALMFALVQVTEVRLFSSSLEGSPDSIVRCDLVAIH